MASIRSFTRMCSNCKCYHCDNFQPISESISAATANFLTYSTPLKLQEVDSFKFPEHSLKLEELLAEEVKRET